MLPRPVGQAWQALTDAEHTVRWLGRIDVGAIVEGMQFHLWHDEEVRSHHTVLHWHVGHRLVLTWDFPGEQPSRVTFALAEGHRGGATLTVHHQDLQDAVSYAAGWHRHLQYLDAHLHGDDLPLEDFWNDYDDLVTLYGTKPPGRDAHGQAADRHHGA